MNNRMQKNPKPRQCIHLSRSDQVLMIRAERAAGRATRREAEQCETEMFLEELWEKGY